MRKILSIMLCLLLLAFVVSCENNEMSSSTETSSSSSSSESSSDTESSSVDSSLSSAPSLSDGKLSYDDRGLPIFPAPVNTYTHFTVTKTDSAKIDADCYDTWVFNDYEAYCSFISQYASSVGGVSETMLNDSFIVVVYRREDIRWTENYSYHSFKAGEKCSLVLEYTDYGTEHTDDEYFFHFDIVLVPRSECDGSPLDIDVDLRRHIHLWK